MFRTTLLPTLLSVGGAVRAVVPETRPRVKAPKAPLWVPYSIRS